MPGRVTSFPCDVTDEPRMASTVAAIEKDLGPIVLAVFNAGNYIATPGENLRVRDFRQSFEVNYFGIINGLVPVVERMRGASRGHVVLVGSVTAYFGWPTTAAYGGSKAAHQHPGRIAEIRFRQDEHPHPGDEPGLHRHAADGKEHAADAGADAGQPRFAPHGARHQHPAASKSPSRAG